MDLEAFQKQWEDHLRSSSQSIIAEHGVKHQSSFRMDQLLRFWLEKSKRSAHLAKEVKVHNYAVDTVMEFPTLLYLQEIDENQHKSYSLVEECVRMLLVLEGMRRTLKEQGQEDKPIYLIRFNPHQFKIGQMKYNTPLVQREMLLIRHLEGLFTSDAAAASEKDMFHVVYAFYDMTPEGRPCVWSQPEFSDLLLPFCSCLHDSMEPLLEKITVEPLTTFFSGKNTSDKKSIKALTTTEETRLLRQKRMQEARALQRQEQQESKRTQKELAEAKREIGALKQEVLSLMVNGRELKELKERRKKKNPGSIYKVKHSDSWRVSYKDKHGKWKRQCITQFIEKDGKRIKRPVQELFNFASGLGLSEDAINRSFDKLRHDNHL